MSKRATVNFVHQDGQITGTFVLEKGGVGNLGKTLKKHYRESSSVLGLIRSGILRSVDFQTGVPLVRVHSTAWGIRFDGLENYHEDRLEKFNYFFLEKEERWYYFKGEKMTDLKPL